MSWTKMDKPERAAWPVERDDHAACCLNYGQEHPQVLISGGTDKYGNTLGDAWLFSVATGTWREIFPEGMQPHWGHSLTATILAPGLTEVTIFGGCIVSQWSPQLPGDKRPMITDTAVLTLGCLPSSEEWGLLRVARGGELGSLERMREKMADMSSKMSLFQPVKPVLPASTQQQPMDKPPSPSPLHDSKETKSMIRPGDMPTLPLLIRFPTKTSFISIPQLLGVHYSMLGPLLLKDDRGIQVAALKAENHGSPDLINLAILSKWMEGGGLQPVTWATLSRVMTSIGQVTLAQQVDDGLNT